MMTLFTDLRDDMDAILYHRVRIKHYELGPENEDFDDAIPLVQSGVDVWTSGLIQPVKALEGSKEAVLVQQGKLQTDDKIIFIRGDTETSTTMKVGIGSPVTQEHSIIPEGVIAHPPIGDIVYKKMFCRVLGTGSLSNE